MKNCLLFPPIFIIVIFFFYSDQLPDKPVTIKVPIGSFTIIPDDDLWEELDECGAPVDPSPRNPIIKSS